jgi:hypothetical protein
MENAKSLGGAFPFTNGLPRQLCEVTNLQSSLDDVTRKKELKIFSIFLFSKKRKENSEK